MDFKGAITGDHILFLLKGLLITLEVALIAIVLSFIIGSVIGILRYTKIPVVSQILGVIVEVIRNLPLLLIIFFTYCTSRSRLEIRNYNSRNCCFNNI